MDAPAARLALADEARKAMQDVERLAQTALLAPEQLRAGESDAWRDVGRHATGTRRALLKVIDRLMPAR